MTLERSATVRLISARGRVRLDALEGRADAVPVGVLAPIDVLRLFADVQVEAPADAVWLLVLLAERPARSSAHGADRVESVRSSFARGVSQPGPPPPRCRRRAGTRSTRRARGTCRPRPRRRPPGRGR